MLNNAITAFWFFLPAGIANMTPVFVAKIPKLKDYNYPADLGKKFKGKRILGSHKTIRGFVFGILAGIGATYLQRSLMQNSVFLQNSLTINYLNYNPFTLGFLLSLGALTGDAVKSFFKRQSGVKPGKKWFPFDQLDYILGGSIFSLIYIKLSLTIYFYIFLIYFLLHLLTTVIGYFLKLKDSPI